MAKKFFFELATRIRTRDSAVIKKMKDLQRVLKGEHPIDWPVVPPFILRNFHFMRKYGLRSQVGCKKRMYVIFNLGCSMFYRGKKST